MVLKTSVEWLIILHYMIHWCFRHEFVSPIVHIVPIPFESFLFNIYASNTPSPTLIAILDEGIDMVGNKFAFLTFPPSPPHFYLIQRYWIGHYQRLEHYIYINNRI